MSRAIFGRYLTDEILSSIRVVRNPLLPNTMWNNLQLFCIHILRYRLESYRGIILHTIGVAEVQCESQFFACNTGAT
jgi:hypothetical protein